VLASAARRITVATHSTSSHIIRPAEIRLTTRDALRTPARQGYELLYIAFIALPVLAGIDKFLDVLTDWDRYLAPPFVRLTPFGIHTTMLIVGAIEIAAGAVVALRPTTGAWIVAAWLACIIVNLALLGSALDIALRDFALLLGAIALARLAAAHERHDIA
jgi:hypothetical protein